MGGCTAGGACLPAMSDEAIIVQDQALFSWRPATGSGGDGEVVLAGALGGGDLHARTSGVVDHLARDDHPPGSGAPS